MFLMPIEARRPNSNLASGEAYKNADECVRWGVRDAAATVAVSPLGGCEKKPRK